MARLPALVDVIADIDDRPRGAIDFVARAVREAGFIQTTKRGRGAAEMTEADAAALLLGCYGSREPTQAVETLQGFAELGRAKTRKRAAPAPSWLTGLMKAKTAFDAVAAAIEVAPVIERQAERFDISVKLSRPWLGVIVSARGSSADFRQGFTIDAEFIRKTHDLRLPYEVTTTINLPVLLSLHWCLHPPEPPVSAPEEVRPKRSGARPQR